MDEIKTESPVRDQYTFDFRYKCRKYTDSSRIYQLQAVLSEFSSRRTFASEREYNVVSLQAWNISVQFIDIFSLLSLPLKNCDVLSCSICKRCLHNLRLWGGASEITAQPQLPCNLYVDPRLLCTPRTLPRYIPNVALASAHLAACACDASAEDYPAELLRDTRRQRRLSSDNFNDPL